MATESEYHEIRSDIEAIRKFLEALHAKKEREINFVRQGKRAPAGDIREMRDLEANIEAILARRQGVTQTRTGFMFIHYRDRYRAMMRSWRSRYTTAAMMRERRLRKAAAKERMAEGQKRNDSEPDLRDGPSRWQKPKP